MSPFSCIKAAIKRQLCGRHVEDSNSCPMQLTARWTIPGTSSMRRQTAARRALCSNSDFWLSSTSVSWQLDIAEFRRQSHEQITDESAAAVRQLPKTAQITTKSHRLVRGLASQTTCRCPDESHNAFVYFSADWLQRLILSLNNSTVVELISR